MSTSIQERNYQSLAFTNDLKRCLQKFSLSTINLKTFCIENNPSACLKTHWQSSHYIFKAGMCLAITWLWRWCSQSHWNIIQSPHSLTGIFPWAICRDLVGKQKKCNYFYFILFSYENQNIQLNYFGIQILQNIIKTLNYCILAIHFCPTSHIKALAICANSHHFSFWQALEPI